VALNASLSTTTPYGWLSIGGYIGTFVIPASCAVGDKLVLSNAAGTAPSNDVWTRIAAVSAAAIPEALTTLYGVITTAGQTPTAAGFVMGTVGLP
jgi:hypothetical protein